MPRFGSILLVFLTILRIANAQTLRFEQVTTKDGLLSDEVFNLHQDKKGYIWLFTHYGPMKYNGYEFAPVLKNLPFEESIIYAFYENKEGRKWIANSNKNIYEIINDSAFVVEGTQKCSEELRKPTNEIFQIIVDDSSNIYVKTSLNTSRCTKTGPGKYRYDNLGRMMSDADGCSEHVLTVNDEMIPVWVDNLATRSFNPLPHHIRFHHEKSPLSEPGVFFTASRNSKYWKRFGKAIYTNYFNKIIKIDSAGHCKEIIINGHVLNFTMDSRGHLWLACYREGLIELDKNDSIINRYFKGKTVHDVLADKHNGLWVSTDGSGLYHCSNIDELYYNESDPFGKPVNFIKNIGQKIFIGTTDFTLFVIENGKTKTIAKLDTGLFDDPVDVFSYGPFYVVCYSHHYEILNPLPSGTLLPHLPPKERTLHRPFTLVPYMDSGCLLINRRRIGILKNALALKDAEHIVLKNVDINCRAFCTARLGKNVLIGTDKGVFLFEHDTLVRPSYLRDTEKYEVTRIVIDKAGNTWFCTRGNGIVCLTNRRKLINFTTSHGLSSNIVNDVFFMEDGSALLSNNKGLYYHTVFSSKGINAGRKLLDGEVQSSLVVGNQVYVRTKNGLVLIATRALYTLPLSFFNLRAVYVNDEQANESMIGALSHHQNNLKFKFDVISFSKEKYILKYTLQNATLDSGITEGNEVDLKRLAPGSYTLAVKLKDGESQKEISFPFTIMPAFWQTTWFLLLIILCGLVLVIVAGWVVFKYYRTRALKKSEAEKLIAEYRLIALKAQINPHFMSNCIAAIQHLILQNKVNEANEYLAKFSFLVRQVLNLSNKSLVPLKEEVEMIELYIKLERLRFDKIAVEFQVDPEIDLRSTFIPPLLSQPIIENAIWHGLLALRRDKTPLLSLSIRHEAGTIRIIIEDNGVGRAMSGKSISNSRESKGIAITRQRIENLKFISGQDLASLSYEDLVDVNGTPAGTRVVISLPDNLHL